MLPVNEEGNHGLGELVRRSFGLALQGSTGTTNDTPGSNGALRTTTALSECQNPSGRELLALQDQRHVWVLGADEVDECANFRGG